MKKIITAFLLAMLIPLFAEGGIIKVIGGLSSAKYNPKIGSSDSKMGLTGGVGIETGIAKGRFEADILFSYDRVDFKSSPTNVNYYKFLKFTMPLLFKYKFKDYNFPFIVAGGSCSLTFAERTDSLGKILKDGKTDTIMDFGLVVGAGMEIDLKRSALMFEGRYYKGLANLKLGTSEFKSSGFYVLLGIKFL